MLGKFYFYNPIIILILTILMMKNDRKLKIRSEHISQNILIQFLIYLCLFLITLSSFYSFKFSLNFFFIFSFCLSSLFVLINLKKYFLVVKNSKLILFFI